MRSVLAAAVAATLVVAGCSSESSSDDFTSGDAVECRELGGGWVFVRYEKNRSSMHGVQFGLSTTDAEVHTELELLADEEFEASRRLRVAQGWDDEAVAELAGPQASAQITARLAAMPSCLDQLRGGRS